MNGRTYFEVNVNRYCPDKDFFIVRPASLAHPKDNSVMFIVEEYADRSDAFFRCKDCLVFWPVKKDVPDEIRARHVVIASEDPRLDYCRFFRDNGIVYLPVKEAVECSNGAYISPKAKIGEGVTIMPGAYISGECTIGEGSYIGSGAKLMGEINIGKRVIIRENAVIGADGLSINREADGTPVTMPQFGRVEIEDYVQIGANAVVQRGAIDETRICKYAKIDNSSFVSHNVYVGENTFLVTESVMLGSSSVGKNSMISSNAAIRDGVHVGSNVMVGMGAVVVKDVPDNAVVKGNPAK